MRVLHVIPCVGPARGGPSMVIRTITKAQAEAGLEVHVATTDDDGPGRLDVPGGNPLLDQNVTYWIFRRQTRFYTFSFPLTSWLHRHIHEYDLVHIHALFSHACLAASVLAKRAGVPYIIRPLGTLNQWGMHNRRRWLKRLSFRLIESRMLRNAAGVHYTSEQEEREARLLRFPHAGFIIPNPVEVSQEVPHETFRSIHNLGDRPVVLFLSRLDPRKGIDLLLGAFDRVRTHCQNATLVIPGDGDPAFVRNLKQEAESLGLGAAVLWLGFVEGQRKRALLCEADVFVLPSYSENFGVSVVEALGAGLPVIVSDQVGLHRDIEKAHAGLIVPCRVDSLEAALVPLLTDHAMLRQLGATASMLSSRS